jgi:putative oxidoreductase
MLLVHGANKVWGKGGLSGTTGWFESLGLRPAKVHARLAAATELGAGALMTVGALNPLPAAATIGLMTVAARTDHKGKGFFIFKGGWEYVGVVGMAATALACLGHGRYSVDRLIGNGRRGGRWGLAALALGVGNAAALLATSYRPPEDKAE